MSFTQMNDITKVKKNDIVKEMQSGKSVMVIECEILWRNYML